MTQPMLAEAVAPVERVLPLDRSGDIALLGGLSSIAVLVSEHAHEVGQISPRAAHAIRCRLAGGATKSRPALLLDDFMAAYDCFMNQHPEVSLSFDEYVQALPWNACEASALFACACALPVSSCTQGVACWHSLAGSDRSCSLFG